MRTITDVTYHKLVDAAKRLFFFAAKVDIDITIMTCHPLPVLTLRPASSLLWKGISDHDGVTPPCGTRRRRATQKWSSCLRPPIEAGPGYIALPT